MGISPPFLFSVQISALMFFLIKKLLQSGERCYPDMYLEGNWIIHPLSNIIVSSRFSLHSMTSLGLGQVYTTMHEFLLIKQALETDI